MRFNDISVTRFALAGALLLGTSVFALAQQAPPAVAPPPSEALAGMVTADTATHAATLTGTGAEGMAWVEVDEQNLALKWTIEYTGATATGAWISCDAAAPAAGAGAAPAAGGGAAAVAGAGQEPNRIDLAGTNAADRGLASPMQGESAGLDPALFALVASGVCSVVIQTEGNAEALTGMLETVVAADVTPAAGAAAAPAAGAPAVVVTPAP